MLLSHLEYLVAVHRCGSMNRAAAELFCSQPTITNAVKSIEKELGAQIMQRNGAGVTFTPLGEQIVEESRVILGIIDNWKQRSRTSHLEFRIAFAAGSGQPPLIGTLSEYQRERPEVKIRLVPTLRRGVRVLSGETSSPCRFGFFAHTPEELVETAAEAKNLGLRLAKIANGVFELCFASSSPLAALDKISSRDLVGKKVVLKGGTEGFPYVSRLLSLNCDCSTAMGDHMNVMITLLNNPDMIGFRPQQSLVYDAFATNGLILHRPLEDMKMELNQYIVYPEYSRLSAEERDFIEYLRFRSEMFEPVA